MEWKKFRYGNLYHAIFAEVSGEPSSLSFIVNLFFFLIFIAGLAHEVIKECNAASPGKKTKNSSSFTMPKRSASTVTVMVLLYIS